MEPASSTSPSENALLTQGAEKLAELESAASSGEAAQLEKAITLADELLALLEPVTPANEREADIVTRLKALTWAQRGNALRDQGAAASRADALRAYDQALALLQGIPAASDPRYRNDLANVWTNRGIALLNENTAESLAASLPCFDNAIELRRNLPLSDNPWHRFGLISGWMNRADALTRLGSPENLAAALASHTEAIDHLTLLPLEKQPAFRRRFVIARINQALTLQKIGGEASLVEAINSLDQALLLLCDVPMNEWGFSCLIACVWANRASVLLDFSPPEAAAARIACQSALEYSGELETRDLVAAEAGFKARHALCRAAAHLLASGEDDKEVLGEWIDEATQAVDDGMSLARAWESRGHLQFRPLATELFRFGARIYQVHQPNFLTEFLLENLDPAVSPGAFTGDAEMYASAIDALWRTFREIQNDGFKTLNTPRFEQLVELLRELRVTDARLAELQQRNLQQGV